MKLRAANSYIMFLISDVFMQCIDTETCAFVQLPFAGGIMDQPYVMMQYLNLIKLNFLIYKRQKQEEQMQKAKSGSRRARGI